MDATSPDDPLAEELRRRLGEQWADQPVDRDRLLRLLGLVDDPCVRATLGRLSLLERLYLVCDRQLEAGLWNAAFRTITTIDRWERRLAKPAPAPAPRPAPPPPAPSSPDRHQLLELAFVASQQRRDAIPANEPVTARPPSAPPTPPASTPDPDPPFT